MLIDHEDCSTPCEDDRRAPRDFTNLGRSSNPPPQVPVINVNHPEVSGQLPTSVPHQHARQDYFNPGTVDNLI